MKELIEIIEITEAAAERAEGRRKSLMQHYQNTGDKLSLELAQNEEKRISWFRQAMAETHIKLREEKENK